MGEDWARPVVHWEIEALDAERQRAFYGELFKWEIGDGPIMPIPAGIGGPEPGPAGHIRQGERSGIALYVQVRDIRASLTEGGRSGWHRHRRALRPPGWADPGADHRPRGKPRDAGATVGPDTDDHSSVSYRLFVTLEGSINDVSREAAGSSRADTAAASASAPCCPQGHHQPFSVHGPGRGAS